MTSEKNIIKGHNLESKKGRANIFACDIYTGPYTYMYSYKISLRYGSHEEVYGRTSFFQNGSIKTSIGTTYNN